MPMAQGPLSLQTYCFLKLINDFETFPPDSLALLPLRLRYELTRSLPAVDVCQLEQSNSYVQGLDMEKVWASIAMSCGLTEAPTRSKDHLFSEVCRIILHQGPSGSKPKDHILRILFSIQQCPGIEDHSGSSFTDSLHHHTKPVWQLPLRYKEYSALSLSNPADCIRLVLERTQYHPRSLVINDAHRFYSRFLYDHCSPWLEGRDCYHLLVEYLSQVCYLTIDLKDSRERLSNILTYMCVNPRAANIKKVTPFIMNMLSSKGHLKLCELSIISSEFLEYALRAVSPHLKRNGCNKLESLSIQGGQFALLTDTAVLEMARIIESQSSLSRLQLQLYHNSFQNARVEASRLYTALAGVLKQPQLCEMELHLTMPPRGFQKIVHSFIATPRSEHCSLHLEGDIDVTTESTRDLSCLNPPQENILRKTLFLSIRLPDILLQWLCKCVVLHVKELHCSPPTLLNHPWMEVEKLSLGFGVWSDVKLLQNFDHLLQSNHLKHLVIDIPGNDRVIPWLVHGLHKQARLGSLEVLQVKGWCIDDQICQLFEAIVSLPQLENFTLDISLNRLSDRHMKTLYRLWKKRACGKRFKGLVFSFTPSQLSQNIAVFQSITRELVCNGVVTVVH